ncbi:MAG: molybdopterin molybdotransferase MoeA [Anaerolineae bacterium]
MSDLLQVDEAIKQILRGLRRLNNEIIDLSVAHGRVLAEDIVADSDLPPFDNSAMDGFAVRAADSGTQVSLRVVMDIPAGKVATRSLAMGEAARIMTGAPIPSGADAVIPVEDTDADFAGIPEQALPEMVTLKRPVQAGAAIRKAGENIQRGDLILRPGMLLGAPEIGMLASLGRTHMTVVRRPRVALLSSGDELVAINQIPAAGQIRDSNSYALAALIDADGGVAMRQGIAADTPNALRTLFQETLSQAPDMIVSTAGVSVGAADHVRGVLEEIGEIGFWRINLRPGKPLAFGQIKGVPFFGLPGNPVSAMVTYLVLVRPALLALAGKQTPLPTIRAIVNETMHSDGRRTYARVRLHQDGERWLAEETGTQSSGAHLSMVLADGLLVIPEDIRTIEKGTELDVILLKPLQ